MGGAARSDVAFDVNCVAENGSIREPCTVTPIAVTWSTDPIVELPITLLAIWRPGKTEVAEPLMEIARAIDAEKLLLLMRSLLAEAPAPTPVDTEVFATGGNVAFVLDAPGRKEAERGVFRAVRAGGRADVSARRTANDIQFAIVSIVCGRSNGCCQGYTNRGMTE